MYNDKVYVSLTSNLLLKSGGTATNVKVAIKCRPFIGELQDLSHANQFVQILCCRQGEARWLLMCGGGGWSPDNHQESKWLKSDDLHL